LLLPLAVLEGWLNNSLRSVDLSLMYRLGTCSMVVQVAKKVLQYDVVIGTASREETAQVSCMLCQLRVNGGSSLCVEA
jgi:hypothetical protein